LSSLSLSFSLAGLPWNEHVGFFLSVTIDSILSFYVIAVAVEKMDVLLSSETAWASTIGEDNMEMDDDVRLTECGEGFLQMLLAITDRYKILPQPGHK